MKGLPKKALKVGFGSSMPFSVPGILLVKPQAKRNIPLSTVNFATGGSTETIRSEEGMFLRTTHSGCFSSRDIRRDKPTRPFAVIVVFA